MMLDVRYLTSLLVQRPRVDDRRCGFVGAEHYQEVGNHGGLAFLVELHDLVIGGADMGSVNAAAKISANSFFIVPSV